MPDRFPGDPTPLCRPCWRAEQDRRQRAEDEELLARFWVGVGGVEVDDAGEVAVPEPEQCPACGQAEASQACWLCGYTWLRELREQFEQDQEDADADREAEFDRIVERTEAEDRVADVTGWIDRLRATVLAYEAGTSRGRAVELVADLLARIDAARTSARGRPPLTAEVGAVVAVDSDWRSGRRALPGRERTAWLIGCSDRAVYDCWRRLAAVGWATRVRVGGRNSLERRMETGRANDRAEFDVVQLHLSAVDVATRARFVPAALELLGELLQRALAVLAAEQEALDELRARTGTWTDWPEQVRRAQLRAAVARAQDTVTGPIPAALLTANICRSHTVSKGECFSSCSYWGLRFSPSIMIHMCGERPGGRRKVGASRSSTNRVPADLDGPGGRRSPRLARPRTALRPGHAPQQRTSPPWTPWAYNLARELVKLWPWLASVPRPWVAATLGSRLSRDWTAPVLARWVTDQRSRPVLPDPDAPAAYLRTILDEAFTGAVQPPHAARRHAEHRRQVAVAVAAGQAAAHDQLHAELDVRDAAAAADRAGPQTGLAAARAAASASRGPRRRRILPELADAATLDAVRAELDQRHTDESQPGPAELDPGWPDRREPGAGLPAGWRHGEDRQS